MPILFSLVASKRTRFACSAVAHSTMGACTRHQARDSTKDNMQFQESVGSIPLHATQHATKELNDLHLLCTQL